MENFVIMFKPSENNAKKKEQIVNLINEIGAENFEVLDLYDEQFIAKITEFILRHYPNKVD